MNNPTSNIVLFKEDCYVLPEIVQTKTAKKKSEDRPGVFAVTMTRHASILPGRLQVNARKFFLENDITSNNTIFLGQMEVATVNGKIVPVFQNVVRTRSEESDKRFALRIFAVLAGVEARGKITGVLQTLRADVKEFRYLVPVDIVLMKRPKEEYAFFSTFRLVDQHDGETMFYVESAKGETVYSERLRGLVLTVPPAFHHDPRTGGTKFLICLQIKDLERFRLGLPFLIMGLQFQGGKIMRDEILKDVEKSGAIIKWVP